MSRTHRSRPNSTRNGTARVAVGATALLVLGQLASMPAEAAAEPPETAQAATFIALGAAEPYSVLGGAGVANTGATVLAGHVGLSPAGALSGFPLGTAEEIHDKDDAAAQAQAARQVAYENARTQPSTTTFGGDQIGKTFKPGVHTSAAAFANTGTMTLDADGDSSAVFVFQIGAAWDAAASSKLVLTDGALANNVYWQVLGATSFGAGAEYAGTFLAAGAVALGEGASLKGRVLTPGTVALANNSVSEPVDDFDPPVVTIDGGESRSTNDTTPPISGTTDEPAGSLVTVTVGGQTMDSAVTGVGTWTVSAAALAPGTHLVTATSTDGSRNDGTATQELTVDVTAPGVSLHGGARRATNDTTPTISGTSDVPGGSPVTVTVAGQTLGATVDALGGWSIDAATLDEAPHSVVASVVDDAMNAGSASQVLSVDLTVPVVAIDGGAARATEDTSPWVYGTTAEQAGTTVRVAIGGQSLTASVLAGGTWGVSATTLPAGAHTVVAAITDAAQNTGSATQSLTIARPTPVDPVAPPPVYRPDASIRIAGGTFVGAGTYGADQRVSKRLAPRAAFEVRIVNRGDTAERLTIRGTPSIRTFAVTYFAGGRNVTPAVRAGSYATASLAPGQAASLVVKVARTRAARRGNRHTVSVVTTSSHTATRRDTVAAHVFA